MSFFDEADDEPSRTEIRRPSRPSSRRPNSGGSGSGGRRRPPSGSAQQSIVVRRAVAVLVLIVIIVLIAVGVSSCQSSARKSALQDYANNVASLISRSQQTSKALFAAIQSAGSDSTRASNSINSTRATAQSVLAAAKRLSVPSAVKTANAHLVFALQMRLDGITNIASEIQPALGHSVSASAVDEIAAQMAHFYASDVIYIDYAASGIVSALHGDDIAVGGESGAPINGDQFLPSLDWLRPAYIRAVLGVSSSGSGSGSSAKVTGLHGDSLIAPVTVNGTALTAGGSNTVSASPAPTFTLTVSNGGDFNESDVVCKVTVTGTSVSGTKVIGMIDKGATATCAVTLSSAPPTGTHNIVATVERVLGEKNISNNTLSYPVTFN